MKVKLFDTKAFTKGGELSNHDFISGVVCNSCGAENSISWDKHCIGIDDKQGSYKDLSFQFCEECGDVTNVDFS